MSMFSSAINAFRSTVSNPKFYASARAAGGRAMAAANAYAPRVASSAREIASSGLGTVRQAWADPGMRKSIKIAGAMGAGSALAGAAIDRKHRVRGGLMGGALGPLGVGGAYLDRRRGR